MVFFLFFIAFSTGFLINDNSILYYIMNVYVNNKNEKVVTLTIFSEDTNQILISYS